MSLPDECATAEFGHLETFAAHFIGSPSARHPPQSRFTTAAGVECRSDALPIGEFERNRRMAGIVVSRALKEI
jgi:hypothetical protein